MYLLSFFGSQMSWSSNSKIDFPKIDLLKNTGGRFCLSQPALPGFNLQILVFTPFCNLKRYFCVFWQFYTQILTKIPQIKKNPKLWSFWQNYKILQYTTLGQRIFFSLQILFFTPFCNLKQYFCVFWQFYTQILTKN